MAELAAEQFILTVCATAMASCPRPMNIAARARRSGHHQYRQHRPQRRVVASFPAVQADQLMLVTDQAKLIRLPLAPCG
jgi:DNA gyrase subunit A